MRVEGNEGANKRTVSRQNMEINMPTKDKTEKSQNTTRMIKNSAMRN